MSRCVSSRLRLPGYAQRLEKEIVKLGQIGLNGGVNQPNGQIAGWIDRGLQRKRKRRRVAAGLKCIGTVDIIIVVHSCEVFASTENVPRRVGFCLCAKRNSISAEGVDFSGYASSKFGSHGVEIRLF